MKEKKKINKKDIIDKILLGIIALICAFVSIFGLVKGANPNTLNNTPKTTIKNYHKDNNGNLVSDNILTDEMISNQTINGITITNLHNGKFSFYGTATDNINARISSAFATTKDKYYSLCVYNPTNMTFDATKVSYFRYEMITTSSDRIPNALTVLNANNRQCKKSYANCGINFVISSGTEINFTCYIQFYESVHTCNYNYFEYTYYSKTNYDNNYEQGVFDSNKSFAESGVFSLTNNISNVRLKIGTLYYGDDYKYDLALDYYESIGGDTDRSDISFIVYNSNRGTIEINMLKACRYALWQYTLGQHSYYRQVYGQITDGVWGYYINTDTTGILSDYFALLSNNDLYYSQLVFDFNTDYVIQDLQCFYYNTFAYDLKAIFYSGNYSNYFSLTRNNSYSQLNLINSVVGDTDMPTIKCNQFILFNETNNTWNMSQLSNNSNVVFSMNYNIVGSQYRNGYDNGYFIGYSNGCYDTKRDDYDNLTKEQISENAVANYVNNNQDPINLGDIMESIFEYPYKLVKDGLDVDFLGINLASVCIFIIGAFLTIFIVKKVLK